MKSLPNERGRLKYEEELRSSRADEIRVPEERTFIMVEALNRAELIYRDEFVGGSHQRRGQFFVAVQSTIPFLIDFFDSEYGFASTWPVSAW